MKETIKARKNILTAKRHIFIMGCIFCMMFSTVSLAKTYVGNMSTITVSSGDLTIRGNASYKYGVLCDKIYCYATISGKDADSTIKSGPKNGVEMKTDYSGATITARVYGTDAYKAASASKKVSTKNKQATVKFYIDGDCKLTHTLIGK